MIMVFCHGRKADRRPGSSRGLDCRLHRCSLWWERCVIASKAPGYLVLEGLGFGHGCGLSQVSAWHLAKLGASPEAIVARFYAGAKIERRY